MPGPTRLTIVFLPGVFLTLWNLHLVVVRVSPGSSSSLWSGGRVQQSSYPTIDILSIGSETRPDYQDEQEATFASHSVRNYIRATEANDTSEPECTTNLTYPTIQRILHYCGKRPKPAFPLLDRIKRLYTDEAYLAKKIDAVGWMCAQKRPMDALASLFEKYRTSSTLPDYLFIVDDDTWVHLPAVVEQLSSHYPPPAVPSAVTGCLARMRKVDFTFAYGGWGTVWTRGTIQAWMRSIDCGDGDGLDWDLWKADNSTTASPKDTDTAAPCRRLAENLVGERDLFANGMSVADLMAAYVQHRSYSDFDNWQTRKGADPGFCMHSDVTIAYFLNYYGLAEHSGERKFANVTVDRLQAYLGSHYYVGRQDPGQRAHRKECLHKSDDTCGADAHWCHYITPQRMRELHAQQQQVAD